MKILKDIDVLLNSLSEKEFQIKFKFAPAGDETGEVSGINLYLQKGMGLPMLSKVLMQLSGVIARHDNSPRNDAERASNVVEETVYLALQLLSKIDRPIGIDMTEEKNGFKVHLVVTKL
jgi:hypothetical protein